jgi:uncharacterized membrane protein
MSKITMSKRVKIILAMSLLLNFLLVGFIAGNAVQRIGDRLAVRQQVLDLTVELSADKRKILLSTMMKLHADSKDILQDIIDTREKVLAAIAADEFNETSFQSHVEKLHHLRKIMKQRLADAAASLARKFDKKERKVLAKFFRNPPGPLPAMGPPAFIKK